MPTIQRFKSGVAGTYTQGAQKEQIFADRSAGVKEQELSNLSGVLAPIAKTVADNYDFQKSQDLHNDLTKRSDELKTALSEARTNNRKLGETGLDIDYEAYELSEDTPVGDLDLDTYKKLYLDQRTKLIEGREGSLLRSRYDNAVIEGYNRGTTAGLDQATIDYTNMKHNLVIAKDDRAYDDLEKAIHMGNMGSILSKPVLDSFIERAVNTDSKHVLKNSNQKSEYISNNLSRILKNVLASKDGHYAKKFLDGFSDAYENRSVKLNGEDVKLSSFIDGSVLALAESRSKMAAGKTEKINTKFLDSVVNGSTIDKFTDINNIAASKESIIAKEIYKGAEWNKQIEDNRATYPQAITALRRDLISLKNETGDSLVIGERVSAINKLIKGFKKRATDLEDNQNALFEGTFKKIEDKDNYVQSKGLISKVIDKKDKSNIASASPAQLLDSVFPTIFGRYETEDKATRYRGMSEVRGELPVDKRQAATLYELGNEEITKKYMPVVNVPLSEIKKIYTETDDSKKKYLDSRKEAIDSFSDLSNDTRIQDFVDLALNDIVIQSGTGRAFDSRDKSDIVESVVRDVKSNLDEHYISYEYAHGNGFAGLGRGTQTKLIPKNALNEDITPQDVSEIRNATDKLMEKDAEELLMGVVDRPIGMSSQAMEEFKKYYFNGQIESELTTGGKVKLIYSDSSGLKRDLGINFDLKDTTKLLREEEKERADRYYRENKGQIDAWNKARNMSRGQFKE